MSLTAHHCRCFGEGALEEQEMSLSDVQQQYEDQLAELKERRQEKQSRLDGAM